MCHSVTERYLSLGSTLPSASRAKGDLLEPDEEAPVGAEAEGWRNSVVGSLRVCMKLSGPEVDIYLLSIGRA